MAALGPRGALHLRAPRLAVRELYRLAEALTSLQGETGCWLVVVDRVDVAAGAGARGVQLTSQSVSVADARRVAPTLAAGASVHSEAEAGGAAADGAAWVVASDIHAPRAPLVAGAALDRARAVVRRAAPVPVIVIGGVLPAHVAPLRSTGVYGVAVIRGIWEAENAERAATDYLSAHDAQGAA
jgi:thiamine-phosphate diphosphorylase